MRMARRFAFLVVVAAVALGLGSCTWLLSGLNHIDIDGERYDIDRLELWYLGDDSGVQAHFLVFTSEGVDISVTDGADGNGQLMLLVVGLSGRDLVEGDYNYSNTIDTFAFGGGGLVAGARFQTGTLVSADYDAELEGGGFAVRETLDGAFVFEFDFDGYDYESKQTVDVVGRFRGSVSEKRDVSAVMSGSVLPAVRSMLGSPARD